MGGLINRLKEPSTYSGLGGIAVVLGMTQDGFTQLVMAVSGVFAFIAAVFMREGGS